MIGNKGGKRYVLVPDEMIVRVLQLKHDKAGHFGADRTATLVRESGYLWLGMLQDVKNYCRSCVICARSNDPQRRLRAPLEMTTQPTAPWQHISVDLMGPFGRAPTKRGNRYVIVVLDLFSKGVEIAAIPDKSAETVAGALTEVIYRHGLPESILTDRGLEFDNQYLLSLSNAMGIDKKRVSAFHPQSNGAVERANKTIGSLLRRNAQEYGESWDTCTGLVRFQYMTAPHHTTGYSPFYLQYGRHPRAPEMARLDDAKAIRSEQEWVKRLKCDLQEAHKHVVVREMIKKEKRNERSGENNVNVQYHEGDRVFMKVPKRVGMPGKLQTRWEGPFIIISCRQGNTYRVKKEDNFRQRYVRHYDELKPVEQRNERLQDECGRKQNAEQQSTRPRLTVEKRDAKREEEQSLQQAQDMWDSDGLEEEEEEEQEEDGNSEENSTERAARAQPQTEVRRSARERHPPDRYGEWTV